MYWSKIFKYSIARSFSKKTLKKFTPEPYLETKPIIKERKINDVEIKVEVFDARTYKRGLFEDEKAIPISPKIGPIRVDNPKISDKTYRWCSCGMSLE